MQRDREAALRAAAAEFYPFLPARMWTSAAHLTELVARSRGIGAEATDRANRVLSEDHFRFRGGGDWRNGERPDTRLGWKPAPSGLPAQATEFYRSASLRP
jgi:hypothetical protein